MDSGRVLAGVAGVVRGVFGEAGPAAGLLGVQLVAAALSGCIAVSGREVAVGAVGRGEGVGGEEDAGCGSEGGVVSGRGRAVGLGLG